MKSPFGMTTTRGGLKMRRATAPRRGVAALEAAYTLPVLLILVLGILECGRLLWVKQILDNAAREGARRAASGSMSTSEVQAAVKSYIKFAGLNIASMPDPTITNLTNASRSNPLNAEQLDILNVSITLPSVNFRWVTDSLTPASLTSQATWACAVDSPVGTASSQIPAE